MRKTLSPFSMQFLAKLLTRERLALKSPSLTGMIKDIREFSVTKGIGMISGSASSCTFVRGALGDDGWNV